MDSLETLVEKAKKTLVPTNCIGTSLFIAGFQKQDRFKSGKNLYDSYLKGNEIEYPEKFCFVSWERLDENDSVKKVVHLGIISEIKPLKVISRKGRYYKGKNQDLTEEYFKEVNEIYGFLSDRIRFYANPKSNKKL